MWLKSPLRFDKILLIEGAIALLNFVYDGFLALHRAKNLK